MTDPTQNFDHPAQHPAQIDTRGLEELFSSEHPAQIGEHPAQNDREHPAHWSLQDASKNLGISLATVRRKLASGALKGYKVPGQNGPEWRVIDPAQVREHPAQAGEHPAQIGEHPAQIVRELDANQLQGSNVISIFADVAEDQDEGQADGQAQGPAAVDPALVKELLAKLEALTYRNGYLEAQLTERQKEVDSQREQIKLLTDSQHKPGWWQRFSSWFFGAR